MLFVCTDSMLSLGQADILGVSEENMAPFSRNEMTNSSKHGKWSPYWGNGPDPEEQCPIALLYVALALLKA